MYDGTLLMDAVGYIDDGYLNGYFETKYDLIRKNKIRKRVIKWSSAVACCLLVAILLPVLNSLPANELKGSGLYVEAPLISNGEQLFFIDNKYKNGLYGYDNEKSSLQNIVNTEVESCEFVGNTLFYYNSDGLFMRNIESADEQLILEFGKETRFAVKTVDDKTVLDADVFEKCSDFIVDGEIVFFLYRATKTICIENNSRVGTEILTDIYSFNISTAVLSSMKSEHMVSINQSNHKFTTDDSVQFTLSDISAQPEDYLANQVYIIDLYKYGDDLFYCAESGKIYRLNANTKETALLYNSESYRGFSSARLAWNNGVGYFVEDLDELYLTKISLADGNILRKKLSVNNGWKSYCFDETSNSYYSVIDTQIVRIECDDPQNRTVVGDMFEIFYDIGQDIYGMDIEDIAIVDNKVFLLYTDPLHRTDDYCIVKLQNGNAKIIVKNGKAE